jgi:hypothetical protein
MQNPKPTQFSAVADALDRVVTVAPAPLLPGEKQADYADVAVRIVRAASPRDAVEEFLVRDVIDLTWEVFRLRRARSGMLKASMSAGVCEILKGQGHGARSSSFLRAGAWGKVGGRRQRRPKGSRHWHSPKPV